MVITFRTTLQMERALARAARMAGVSKSEFVRRCLHERLAKESTAERLYEVGKNRFGKYGSGRGDLAENAESILRERFRAQARRR
jgi:hypothetical protein